MKDKTSHGGSAITVTEYEVRDIDEYGDSQDVNHYGSKREAMEAAKKSLATGSKAVAVEKHISRRPAFLFNEPDTFTTVAVMGDKDALDLWGWKPGIIPNSPTRAALKSAGDGMSKAGAVCILKAAAKKAVQPQPTPQATT